MTWSHSRTKLPGEVAKETVSLVASEVFLWRQRMEDRRSAKMACHSTGNGKEEGTWSVDEGYRVQGLRRPRFGLVLKKKDQKREQCRGAVKSSWSHAGLGRHCPLPVLQVPVLASYSPTFTGSSLEETRAWSGAWSLAMQRTRLGKTRTKDVTRFPKKKLYQNSLFSTLLL